MIEYVGDLLKAMRPAFSRQMTFTWFVLVFVGFVMRNDTFGVSSIVRALWLDPSCYACLLHFFHSTKDGRRMPEVSTLRQDSETSSKPTFFRGHHWACIGLLVNAGRKFFATPLWTEIHRDSLQHSQSTRIVAIAGHIAKVMENKAYLIVVVRKSTGESCI